MEREGGDRSSAGGHFSACAAAAVASVAKRRSSRALSGEAAQTAPPPPRFPPLRRGSGWPWLPPRLARHLSSRAAAAAFARSSTGGSRVCLGARRATAAASSLPLAFSRLFRRAARPCGCPLLPLLPLQVRVHACQCECVTLPSLGSFLPGGPKLSLETWLQVPQRVFPGRRGEAAPGGRGTELERILPLGSSRVFGAAEEEEEGRHGPLGFLGEQWLPRGAPGTPRAWALFPGLLQARLSALADSAPARGSSRHPAS